MSENQIEIIGNRDVELLEKNRKINIQKLFTPEGMDLMLAEIEKEITGFTADVSTKEGRAAIVSMAAKIAKCKKPIKDLSMEAKEESRKFIDGVQEQWNRYEAKINEFHAKVRKPVDEIEEAEAKQLQERQERIAKIENFRNFVGKIEDFQLAFHQLEQLSIFDWGDFSFKVETLKTEIHALLCEKLAKVIEAEEQRIELEKLRKEKAERDQKDREDQIAKDAAENARKAEEERIKKIEEDKRVAQEKLVIEERKTFLTSLGFIQDIMTGDFVFKGKKSMAKIVTSSFLTKDVEEWKKTMIDADIWATNILQENKQFAKDEEKRIADEATEKERKRVAEELDKKLLEDEKRERNKRHRKKIEENIILEIMNQIRLGDEKQIRIIVGHIAAGHIPHVQINY